jgi:hypothetical protein
MPRVEFEPTFPVFEREKKVHALDGAANVIGHGGSTVHLIIPEELPMKSKNEILYFP